MAMVELASLLCHFATRQGRMLQLDHIEDSLPKPVISSRATAKNEVARWVAMAHCQLILGFEQTDNI
jgi:hypothetical protein